jgi:hypothetical protein
VPSAPAGGAIATGAERTGTPEGTISVFCSFSSGGTSWTTDNEGIIRK